MDSIGSNTINDFLAALASERMIPAGGGAAALSGAMGAALISMTAKATLGREKYRLHFPIMKETSQKAESLWREMLSLAQDDVLAFAAFEKALFRPQSDFGEKASREQAIKESWRMAIEASSAILKASHEGFALATMILGRFNKNAAGDYFSAIQHLNLASEVSWFNLKLNQKKYSSASFDNSLYEKSEARYKSNNETFVQIFNLQ